MKVQRTPDSRFANLADYPFAPHYHQITQQGAPAGEAPSAAGAERAASRLAFAMISANGCTGRPSNIYRLRFHHPTKWAHPRQEVQYEKRSFEIDVLGCPGCGGRLRLLATIEEPEVVRKILSHLGIPTECPEPLPARLPPWATLSFPVLSGFGSG